MATVEELGGNRVRLTVEVPAAAVHHAVEHALNDLAESVKIPGFRQGTKVPTQVLVSRLGRDRIYSEAVDSHIGGWFWSAAASERLRPIAQPQYEYELPASDKEDWSFGATVEVQPPPELVDWTQLEVPRAEIEVPAEAVEQALDAMRGDVAELVPVEGRAAREGDTAVIDLVGASGEGQRDTVVELGSGRLVEEIEAAVVGLSPGESRDVDYELAGEANGRVTVTLKELKEKVLPPVDDDLARAASEFDTIAELRADVEGRLREQIDAEIDAAFRTAAVDALVRESRVQPAPALVASRTNDLLTAFARSLQQRGISPEAYLSMAGRTPEQLQAAFQAEAAIAVARELALEALADRMGIEVSDDEVKELVRGELEDGEDAEGVIEELWAHGRHEGLREDLRLRAALDRLVAEVKPISTDLAEAREQIWTPEQEAPATETKLWTPGTKEPA